MSVRPPSCTPRPRQRGQATTEFVVLALALLPLYLAVSLLARYIDLAQTVEQTSRYVAFEHTVRQWTDAPTAEAQLAGDVGRRFLGPSTAPVKTGDVAGAFQAHRNPLWSDPAANPLIDDPAARVHVRSQLARSSPITAGFSRSLDLPQDTLHTTSVTVDALNVLNDAPLPARLRLSAKTVILTDPWTDRGRDSVRARIEGAAALNPIGSLKALVELAGALPPLVLDPSLEVGRFDWDIVPCDRLIGGC
ncbi:MAG TPA: hypothetical protein VF169_04450 [Albitalea sp.]|uniref:hypothetical protein n=1 Tax=Piscinibacter sp. TaxID=1903157 RepID=UPI002ED3AABE